MQSFEKPILVCSRCLGFDNCRFNGQILYNDLVNSLKPYVEFKTPCPETDIGLGVPRYPVRIIQDKGQNTMFQPSTKSDFTGKMNSFVKEYLNNLNAVDGFILKSKSPSCGIGDVKVYKDVDNPANFSKGDGLFGGEVKRRFSGKAVEDEMRLSNPRILDHFLKKIFTLAAFRKVKKANNIKALIELQTKNKLLYMSYNQKELKNLGNIVASHKKKDKGEILEKYENHLDIALARGPTYKSNINVLHHALGYVSENISREEKTFFLDTIQMYKEDRAPFESCLSLIYSWVLRFDVEYLKNQTLFHPYPDELRKGFEPDRRREFWG
ncbi:MAG: DUF523 and DUF1722 domain-containing protein [Thermoplasmata archaeon]|nr:MAG: DUF523 and DUF1722 domain-containing protein [Thermoplasmata archaeon]